MTVEPGERLTVTLTAQEWNAVLSIMAEAPMPLRVSSPLVNEITRQCMQQGRTAGDSGALLASRGNGDGRRADVSGDTNG